jgi:hypothetical protein
MTDPIAYASAIEAHRRPRFRLNVDEWVAAIAIICLGVGLIAGSMRGPDSAAPSCYNSTPARR